MAICRRRTCVRSPDVSTCRCIAFRRSRAPSRTSASTRLPTSRSASAATWRVTSADRPIRSRRFSGRTARAPRAGARATCAASRASAAATARPPCVWENASSSGGVRPRLRRFVQDAVEGRDVPAPDLDADRPRPAATWLIDVYARRDAPAVRGRAPVRAPVPEPRVAARTASGKRRRHRAPPGIEGRWAARHGRRRRPAFKKWRDVREAARRREVHRLQRRRERAGHVQGPRAAAAHAAPASSRA